MTRPMPGPPECECPMVPPRFWTTHYGAVDPATMIEYNPACPIHAVSYYFDEKRLTDAECAAHYWQAEWLAAFYAATGNYGEQWALTLGEKITWQRFKYTPHALEES